MKRNNPLVLIMLALLLVTTLYAGADGSAKRPDWVILGKKVFGYGVGFAPKTEAGLGYQRREAIAQAEIDLARSAKKRVMNMVETYFQTVGIRHPHLERVTTQVSRIVTDMMIGRTRMVDYWIDRDGTLYVLIYAKPSEIVPAIKKRIEKDRALRQTLHARHYHRELDRVIERFFDTDAKPTPKPRQKSPSDVKL